MSCCSLFVWCHIEETVPLAVNASLLCFPELHATLETLRQRHGQRSGLCPWGAVCQSYLFWGQQSFREYPVICYNMSVTRLSSTLRLMYQVLSWCVLQVEDMVAEIKWAFEDSLKTVGWMDPETKKAAKEKVRTDSFERNDCMWCFSLLFPTGMFLLKSTPWMYQMLFCFCSAFV